MVIKTEKGMYKIEKNYRDAFQLDAFVDKYIEECFDKYPYIVGDISAGILRIKGFDNDPKSENYYGFIDDYLELSCAFGCPFYVLKRITNEQEFAKLEAKNEPVDTEGGLKITPITKENFDKETLVLESNPAKKQHNNELSEIHIMPKMTISPEIKEFIDADKALGPDKPTKKQEAPKAEETTASYVSASPDFDPSKKPENKFNRNNKNKDNKQNKENKAQNNNKQNNPNGNKQNNNQNGNKQNAGKQNKPNVGKQNNQNNNKPNNNQNGNKQNNNPNGNNGGNNNPNKNHNKHKNKNHNNNHAGKENKEPAA